MEVLIVFGFTAFLTWYYMIIIGYPAFFPGPEAILVRRIIQFMSFVGMLAACSRCTAPKITSARPTTR